MIGARIAALAVGYVLGLFQTGYIYGKKHGVDIRTQGSGNAGTTNTLRVLGWKAGLVTFAGDLFKAIFAVVIIHFLFIGKYPDSIKLLELYAGFGAVLGHNFPCYLKFKGGKGIACTSGMILAVCPLAAPICLILFIGAVAITRYVSLGSIVAIALSPIIMWFFNARPAYIIYALIAAVYVIYLHRENIKRLRQGTENKVR